MSCFSSSSLPVSCLRDAARRSAAAGLFFLICAALAGCGGAADAARFNDGFCSVGTEELNTAFDHWYQRWQNRTGGPDASVPATQARPKPIHEGRGNATAPAALRKGVCDLAPMSRPMSDSETHAFVETYGAPPIAVPVALEALAIIAPAGSHVRELSRAQVRAIFHQTPHALEDLFPYIADTPHQGRELDAFGVNSASDRYRWFRNHALEGAAVSDRVVEVSGPLALVDRVGESRHAFGYARPAELTDAVKDLAVDGVRANESTAASGAYPYVRYLYVYIPPRGDKRPNPEAIEFLRFILSPEQQSMLRPLGLYPLSERDRAKATALLP
ncbi:MAG: substrate-binding domain-containing protein [Leptospirales bacterium]|jgi:phosphate transport system substrate-binding protein